MKKISLIKPEVSTLTEISTVLISPFWFIFTLYSLIIFLEKFIPTIGFDSSKEKENLSFNILFFIIEGPNASAREFFVNE